MSAKAASRKRVPEGKRVPDLVLVMDSDPKRQPEFRVQCEVELTPAEAKYVYDALYPSLRRRNSGDVNKAHRKIKDKVAGLPLAFRQMIYLAFNSNGSTEPWPGPGREPGTDG